MNWRAERGLPVLVVLDERTGVGGDADGLHVGEHVGQRKLHVDEQAGGFTG